MTLLRLVVIGVLVELELNAARTSEDVRILYE